MSWYYEAGDYRDSTYATYPAFDPSSGSQGRIDYTQASTVASTSAIPYTPPLLPQNSAPPAQFVPHYRPPTTTFQSSAHLDRPAHPTPTLTPSFAPPPLPQQSWNYEAVPPTSSAPLPPTYPPPEAFYRAEKKSQPSPTAPSRSLEGGKKKRTKKPLADRSFAQKASGVKAFTSSIVVLGRPNQITSIKKITSCDNLADKGYRSLNFEELKSLSDLAKAARKNYRSRDKRERRIAALNVVAPVQEKDPDAREDGEAIDPTMGIQKSDSFQPSDDEIREPQYLSLLDFAQATINEIVRNECESNRDGSRPRDLAHPSQIGSRFAHSKKETQAPPHASTPLIDSPQMTLTISVISASLSINSSDMSRGMSKGSETSPVPDSTLPSSVAPMIIDSAYTTSLSTPLPAVTTVSSLPNPDSPPQSRISAVQQPPLRNSSLVPPLVPSLVPAEVGGGADLNSSLDHQPIVAVSHETFEGTKSKEGESRMGQDETCELEVKKETTTSAEDPRAIKEEEDPMRFAEESAQSFRSSNALVELTSTPVDSGATLNSLEYPPQSADTYRHSDVPIATKREDSRVAREGVSTRLNEKEPPSSDLSDVDEGAITESGSDDSGADSITEVLAKRKARRESSASTIRLSKKQAVVALTLFDHLNNLLEQEDMYTLWCSDPSVSTLTRAFVQERREIFHRQRAFLDPVKQREAIRIATSAKGIKKSTLRGYLGCFASYFTFCTIAEIPAFPVTTSSIALFLYQYRVNWPELSRGVHPSALRSFARRTAHLFEDYPNEFTELDSWPGAQDVVRELQKPIAALQTVSATSIERKTTTASRTNSPAVQSKPTPPPSKPAILQPIPARPHFDIVIPQRHRSRRARRPSNSPMFIESSISFASPKSAISSELRNIPVPENGDRFKSLRAVKMSTAVANVFSQGYEVFTTSNSTSASLRCLGPGSSDDKGCTHRIHATLNSLAEEWVIDECNEEHTHGPSQSLDDEEWRPFTMDRDTIEAMWQVDRRGQLDESLRKLVIRKRSRDPPQDDARPSKKVRTSSPSSSLEFSSEQSFLARSPIPPRSPVEPSRSDTSSSSSLLQKSHLSNESSSPAPFTHPITKAESINISLPPSLPSDDPNNLDLSTPPAPRVVS